MQSLISYVPLSNIEFNYEVLSFNIVFELSEQNVASSKILEYVLVEKFIKNNYSKEVFEIQKVDRLKKGGFIVVQIHTFTGAYTKNNNVHLNEVLIKNNEKIIKFLNQIEQSEMENSKIALIKNLDSKAKHDSNGRDVIKRLFPKESYTISHLPSKKNLENVDWLSFQHIISTSKKVVSHVGSSKLCIEAHRFYPDFLHTPVKLKAPCRTTNEMVKTNKLDIEGKILFLCCPPHELDGGVQLQLVKIITHKRLLKELRNNYGVAYDLKADSESFKNFILYEVTLNLNNVNLLENDFLNLVKTSFSQKIMKDEYKEAVSYLKRQMYEIFEEPYLMSDFLFNQYLHGLKDEPNDYLSYLEKLTYLDLQLFLENTELSSVFIY